MTDHRARYGPDRPDETIDHRDSGSDHPFRPELAVAAAAERRFPGLHAREQASRHQEDTP